MLHSRTVRVLPGPLDRLHRYPVRCMGEVALQSPRTSAPADSTPSVSGRSEAAEKAWEWFRSIGSPQFHVAPMVDQVRVCSGAKLKSGTVAHDILTLCCDGCSQSYPSGCYAEGMDRLQLTHPCFIAASSQRIQSTVQTTSQPVLRTGAALRPVLTLSMAPCLFTLKCQQDCSLVHVFKSALCSSCSRGT